MRTPNVRFPSVCLSVYLSPLSRSTHVRPLIVFHHITNPMGRLGVTDVRLLATTFTVLLFSLKRKVKYQRILLSLP
jgi:hypothetical protein